MMRNGVPTHTQQGTQSWRRGKENEEKILEKGERIKEEMYKIVSLFSQSTLASVIR